MQYWADLQSVQGFHCYDNIHVCKRVALYTGNAYRAEREMSASVCLYLLYGWSVSSDVDRTAFQCSTLDMPLMSHCTV